MRWLLFCEMNQLSLRNRLSVNKRYTNLINCININTALHRIIQLTDEYTGYKMNTYLK